MIEDEGMKRNERKGGKKEYQAFGGNAITNTTIESGRNGRNVCTLGRSKKDHLGGPRFILYIPNHHLPITVLATLFSGLYFCQPGFALAVFFSLFLVFRGMPTSRRN